MDALVTGFVETLASHPALQPPRRFVVALSGGLDSTVLLDVVRRGLPQFTGAALEAVHVNHGLYRQADSWQQHCIDTARTLGVRCTAIAVDAHGAPGESPEAAARDARYAALLGVLAPGDVLLTAHHQDDQLETVLLQLMRGAGVAGLAGMPVLAGRGPGWHMRPLLDVAHSDIKAYAQRHELGWVDDASNTDPRFDRNYLRAQVVPALRRRWAAAAPNASRAARHCAAAAELIQSVAREDLAATRDPHGRLPVAALQALDPVRCAGLLRQWIGAHGLPVPSSAHLSRCLSDLLSPRADTEACVSWPGAELRRFRDHLYAQRPLAPAPESFRATLFPNGRGCELPAGLGTLRLLETAGHGLSRQACEDGLAVSLRAGGERIRPHDQKHTRQLRTLFQEEGVVPWMRQRMPLLHAGDALAAVGDLWIASAFAAQPGEPALLVHWASRPSLY